MVSKAQQELADEIVQREVLDLIETIVLYKLPKISRQELARMFGLNELKKTRYYQEVREEVREEVIQEVREEVREEVIQEVTQEIHKEKTLGLIIRQLIRRIGTVNPQLQQRIHQLSVVQLENLAEALLDFSSEADLVAWLENVSNQPD